MSGWRGRTFHTLARAGAGSAHDDPDRNGIPNDGEALWTRVPRQELTGATMTLQVIALDSAGGDDAVATRAMVEVFVTLTRSEP